MDVMLKPFWAPIRAASVIALGLFLVPALPQIAKAGELAPAGGPALQSEIQLAADAPAPGPKDTGSESPVADEERDMDKHPYTITADGKVDDHVYSGYKRYHSFCHVCHGPAGKGSSYAPALIESLKTLSYEDFVQIVSNGRNNITTSTTNVMPSFATDPNVMNYLDDIYSYLKARSDGKLNEARPVRIHEKIVQ